jgi:hypothetical protein
MGLSFCISFQQTSGKCNYICTSEIKLPSSLQYTELKFCNCTRNGNCFIGVAVLNIDRYWKELLLSAADSPCKIHGVVLFTRNVT